MANRAGVLSIAFGAMLVSVGCDRSPESTTGARPSNDKGKIVNVYNWSDYIDPAMLEKFTAETGIKVNYDVFDSNEVLETKLLAGNTGYDVVVPTASFLERQIKAGVFRKLDRTQAPELENLDTEILQRVALHDPGNEHSVNLHVGHERHRLQRGQGQGDHAQRAGRQLEDGVRPEGRRRNSRTAASRCSMRRPKSSTIVLAYLGKDPNSQIRGGPQAGRRQC